MKKFPLSLAEIQALHQSGQLAEAKTGYLSLLEMDDQQVLVWHYLGVLHAELGEFAEACNCLMRAIALDPQDVSLYLHFANVLKARGQFEEALQTLRQALEISPSFPALHNNLGSIYFVQSNLPEAIRHYRKAISLQPNYLDAYYNLGLALNRYGIDEEARVVFQSLLEMSPEHPGGLFQLGCLLMQSGQYEAALARFKSLESVYPFHAETQVNLATCYLRLGRLNDAKTHYLKAVDLTPDDTQALFNLGVISMQQGRLADVFAYYQRALAANPNLFEVHNNLAVSYLALKDTQSALMHFKEASRLQPENKAIQHSMAALSGNQAVQRASAAYIEQLFDSYADHYDAHLLSSLRYALPAQMYELAREVLGRAESLNILDLGCGTGLCGQQFKPMAAKLVGVDLSRRMLDEAKGKHCYDQLFHEDVLDFLAKPQLQFDLILAADLLVYLGQLDQLFLTVHQALNRGGWFLFNYEGGADDVYAVQETGRFQHSHAYILQLIKSHSFKVAGEQLVASRIQDGEPIESRIYLIQKS